MMLSLHYAEARGATIYRLCTVLGLCLGILGLPACEEADALIIATPSTIDFGEVAIGDIANDLLQVTNEGGSSTTVVFQVASDGPFDVDLEYPIEVPPGGSRFVFVEVTPTEEGSTTDLLRLLWGSSLSEVALSVTGTASAGDLDQDGFTIEQGDCDDTDPLVHPEATEVCDAIDNNCDCTGDSNADGVECGAGDDGVDEGYDTDLDGVTTCGPDGDDATVADNDCDDADVSNYPGNTEECEPGDTSSQSDNNCDASDDDAALLLYYRDLDGDGVGAVVDATADAVLSCGSPGSDFAPALEDPSAPGSYLQDCDDADAANFPGNTEACDGQDNDCDAATEASGGETDGDLDTSLACADCDDADPLNYPGNVEVCDGQDNNCDSVTDENANDSDGDGYACDDCNDSDDTVYPGAPEVCDGQDTDCNGFDDYGSAGVDGLETDNDADSQSECEGDCDDADPANFTGNSEVCDGQDNDCNGLDDAGNFGVAGQESDDDGDLQDECSGDCDDADPANFTGNTEACDGQDNDCNNAADADGNGEVDSDSDGSLSCEDCDDGNASNTPGSTELCDGTDNDCDPATEAAGGEADGDGDGSLACDDCDDANASNTPGGTELCDGADNDCDPASEATGGESDGDGDGSLACADCDDAEPASYPLNSEICDGIDNDCVGGIPSNELDADADGVSTCNGDCDDANGLSFPGNTEVCDSVDNDCDLSIDESDAWWDLDWAYRIPLTLTAAPNWTVNGPPVVVDVDFRAALDSISVSDAFDANSLVAVLQDCSLGHPTMQTQFLDGFSGLMAKGPDSDPLGDESGTVVFLYDQNSDYSDLEAFPASATQQVALYFGSSSTPTTSNTTVAAATAQSPYRLDSGTGVSVARFDETRGGLLGALNLQASHNLASQSDAGIGNSVYMGSWVNNDPADGPGSITVLEDGPIFAALEASGSRAHTGGCCGGGAYDYTYTYWMFAGRPELWIKVLGVTTGSTTLSSTPLTVGNRPWQAIHNDSAWGAITRTTDQLGHSWEDLSDGTWGVSWAYVEPPTFVYPIIDYFAAYTISTGTDTFDLSSFLPGATTTLSPGTTFFDHIIQLVLPHSGTWSTAEPQVHGLVEGVSASQGTIELL